MSSAMVLCSNPCGGINVDIGRGSYQRLEEVLHSQRVDGLFIIYHNKQYMCDVSTLPALVIIL